MRKDIYGNEVKPVCTSDEVRARFKEYGLTYDDITDGDILTLVILLNREIKVSNKVGETSVNTMKLSEKMDIKHKLNGAIKACFLYMNSHYFTRRECVSFNEDGFIGIAGWADYGNSNPIKRALLKWFEEIKKAKEA